MATTFTEYALNITMANGHKEYNETKICSGCNCLTHTVDVTLSSNTRQVNKQTIDSYSQTVAPQTTVLGYQPETVKLEGVLCHIADVEDLLAETAPYRAINTLYNKFLPCSILECEDSDIPELQVKISSECCCCCCQSKPRWLVDMFKIKRSKQKPDLILFEMVLMRWYG